MLSQDAWGRAKKVSSNLKKRGITKKRSRELKEGAFESQCRVGERVRPSKRKRPKLPGRGESVISPEKLSKDGNSEGVPGCSSHKSSKSPYVQSKRTRYTFCWGGRGSAWFLRGSPSTAGEKAPDEMEHHYEKRNIGEGVEHQTQPDPPQQGSSPKEGLVLGPFNVRLGKKEKNTKKRRERTKKETLLGLLLRRNLL